MNWNLTKPALIYGNQPPVFYNSTPDALSAAMAQLPQAPSVTNEPPTSVSITPALPNSPGNSYGVMQADQNLSPLVADATRDAKNQVTVVPGQPAPIDPRSQAQIGADAQAAPQPGAPQLSTSGGGPQLTPSPTGPLPFYNRPTFAAATDQYGNVKPGGPALTKLGLLANILKSAEQGGSDAIASGALNAEPGKSGFGAGWSGAHQMPLIRAAQARAAGIQNAQAQNLQSETQLHQSESQMHQAQIPYFLQRAKAYSAMADQRGRMTTAQQLDMATQDALDNGRNPDTEPSVLQLRAAYKAEMQAKGSGKGAPQPRPDTPHTVSANGRVLQYNPDTERYDIDIGKAERPSPAVNFNGSGDPVMERRAQQIEQNSTQALTTHQRGIASRIAKLDPGDPSYADQMAAIERDDYQGKLTLAKSYAKQRTTLGLPTQPPTFDPWTNSYLTDDERAKLLAGSTSPAKSSGLPLPWMKKGSTSTNHLPGNPYAQ